MGRSKIVVLHVAKAADQCPSSMSSTEATVSAATTAFGLLIRFHVVSPQPSSYLHVEAEVSNSHPVWLKGALGAERAICASGRQEVTS